MEQLLGKYPYNRFSECTVHNDKKNYRTV